MNTRGRRLIETMKSFDLSALNGCTKSDPNGELSFFNRNGSSCIDLCLVSNSLFTDELDFKVLDFEGSCHFPISLSINSQPFKPKIIRRRKVQWIDEKASIFRDTLSSSLTNHSDSVISISSYTDHITSSLETCGFMKTVATNCNVLNNGPVWYDKKCSLFKKSMNHSLRDLRKCKKTSAMYEISKSKYLD
jgi:hypothetical protein